VSSYPAHESYGGRLSFWLTCAYAALFNG